ncbi:MAG: class I SAM-dependent methyltransferase [Gemmatimonadales bacterium]|nr:class I SAM-dependent methyltransferase [Gemmatimonadales bacterium]
MNKEPSCGLYADPMIYDILYTPGTWREINALERIEAEFARRLGQRLDSDRLWFEPACGSGRYLRTAARRGRRIAGYDIDPAMLDYARKRGTRMGNSTLQIFQADMADFQNPAKAVGIPTRGVDFAFNPVNSIRHLKSDGEMLNHFEQMAALLRPGALYVVGLSLTDYKELQPEEDYWTGTRGRCRVNQLVNYLPPEQGVKLGRSKQLERVISHLTVERNRGTVDHFDHAYDLRCYDRRQWSTLIRKSALDLVGSFDALGRPAPDHLLPYQLDVLVKNEGDPIGNRSINPMGTATA